MVKAKKYVFAKIFDGLPKPDDIKIVEEDLPPLKNGEFLAEAVYFSVDPYMRFYASNYTIGTTLVGGQVAKILESKNPKYPVGKYVVGEFGWRSRTISDGSIDPKGWPAPWIVPDPEGLPLSLFLGILGMPGISAYFGFLEICQPKSGETVVISGAAGAVGSIVGQIAKIKGCKVVGIAGSDDKGKWLVDDLQFDGFVNYKDKDFDKKLGEATPNGIDCYFDNVGGQISTKVINRMNPFGRISVCGSISAYNDLNAAQADVVQPAVVLRQLKMEGFLFHRWNHRWFEGLQHLKTWVKEGKLKYRETVTEGFDHILEALVDMLQGGNYGKAIVKV